MGEDVAESASEIEERWIITDNHRKPEPTEYGITLGVSTKMSYSSAML